MASRTTVADNASTKMKGVDANTVTPAAGFSPDFASNFSGTTGWLLPNFQIGSGFVSGGESVVNTPQATDNNQFSATLNKIKGTHNFAFGASYISSVFSSPLAFDTVSFANNQTSDGNGVGGFPSHPPCWEFPMRQPAQCQRENPPGGLFSAFFQDSWKATPKLTVNYGVRYDLTLIPPYGTKDTFDEQGGIETGDFDFSERQLRVAVPASALHCTRTCTVYSPALCSMLPVTCGCDPATQTCLPPGTLPPHVVVDPRGTHFSQYVHQYWATPWVCLSCGEKASLRGGAGIVYDNWAAVSQMSQNIEGDWPGIGQLIATNLNVPGGSTTDANGRPIVTLRTHSLEVAPLVCRRPRRSMLAA